MQLSRFTNKFYFIPIFTTLCSVVCINASASTGPGTDTVFYTQEVKLLTQLAKAGDNGAQLQLGLAYQNGQYGLHPDSSSSAYWLNAAARGGNAYAADLVANRYNSDKPQQLHDAVYWWKKAARGGNADAEVHLGEYMMHHGEDKKALPLLRKAANLGDRRAHQDLVALYRSDDLGEKDFHRGDNKVAVLAQEVNSTSLESLFALWDVIKASSTYEQSTGPLIARAQQGDPVAEYQLAIHYRDGAWAVNPDAEKSMYWLQRSAAAGNQIAKKDLANTQQQAKTRLTVKDHAALSGDHT
jgi:TPR repeat protein